MTFDTVRQALRSPDPFTEMDRIVRDELAAGRKVREVFDALYPLAGPVLKSPGLGPDGLEALQGTLDALTGDCDPDQCYEDPPDTAHPIADVSGRPVPSAALAGHVLEPRGGDGRVLPSG